MIDLKEKVVSGPWEIRPLSSQEEQRRDPSIANYAFFDKGLNWLCHRIDKKTADHVWCPYYWDCMALIARDKKNGPNDSQVERFD